MKHKSESLIGYIAYFVIFGGSAAALIGADSPEFGDLCRMVLGAECVLGAIILLCVLAYFVPDKADKRRGQAYVRHERIDDRAGRCLGYVTPEAICRAAQENAETCVCCGDVIPEGRQVCPRCEGK